jgi:predicted nucleic acid-binding protein
VIVVDASAALLALLNAGEARRALSNDTLIAPHLIDVEVTSALRRQVRTGVLEAAAAEECLGAWQVLGLERVAVTHLLGRMWELRDNVTPYDAAYVAVAEELDLALLTGDARVANAPGPRCTTMVVRT